MNLIEQAHAARLAREGAHGHGGGLSEVVQAAHGLQSDIMAMIGAAGQGPAAMAGLFAAGLAFGAIHTLLPGHGKTVLAAHHATAAPMGTGARIAALGRAGLDGLLIGVMRVASAMLIVLGGWSLVERGLGGAMRVPVLEAMGGALLAGLGVWMLGGALMTWMRGRTRAGAGGDDGRRPSGLGRLPALAIGLIPDPVTAVVMSYAVLVDARGTGAMVMIGIALGMALTLTASASAGLLARARLEAGGGLLGRAAAHAPRVEHWLRLVGGTLVLGVGARIVLRAI